MRWPVLMYLAGMAALYLFCAMNGVLAQAKTGHDAVLPAFVSPAWTVALGVATAGLLVGVVRRNLLAPLCFLIIAGALTVLGYRAGDDLAAGLNGASILALAVLLAVTGLRRA